MLYRVKVPTTIGLVSGSNNSRFGSEAGSLSNSMDMGKTVDLESEQQQDGTRKFNAVRPMAAAKRQRGSDGGMRLGRGQRFREEAAFATAGETYMYRALSSS